MAVVFMLIAAGCRSPERVAEIPGLSSIRVLSESCLIEKASEGRGSGYILLVGDEQVKNADIRVGGSFTFSNGYHVSNTYVLVAIRDGVAVWDEETNFYWDGDHKRERRTIAVPAYE